jgi:hypothetical protein
MGNVLVQSLYDVCYHRHEWASDMDKHASWQYALNNGPGESVCAAAPDRGAAAASFPSAHALVPAPAACSHTPLYS